MLDAFFSCVGLVVVVRYSVEFELSFSVVYCGWTTDRLLKPATGCLGHHQGHVQKEALPVFLALEETQGTIHF